MITHAHPRTAATVVIHCAHPQLAGALLRTVHRYVGVDAVLEANPYRLLEHARLPTCVGLIVDISAEESAAARVVAQIMASRTPPQLLVLSDTHNASAIAMEHGYELQRKPVDMRRLYPWLRTLRSAVDRVGLDCHA